VTWTDPISLGGPGEGMLLELERQGFDARASAFEEQTLGAHRIIAPGDATGEVHVSFGPDIERWRRAHPGAREVAHADLRTPAQRARYARLKAEAVAGLAAAGLDATNLEDRLSLVDFDPRTPTAVRDMLNEMATLGQPAAVFVSAGGGSARPPA